MTAVILFAAAVLAASTPAPAPAPPASPQAKPTDLICHSEPDPGSRFTHKVCLTRAQLQDRKLMTQQVLSDAHQQGQMMTTQPMATMGMAH